MDIPNNFCSLLIRGKGFSSQEIEHIHVVYKSMGKTGLFDFVKSKKIIPFAANTFNNCLMDEDYWGSLLEEYRNRNKKILTFLNTVYTELRQQNVKKMFVSENFGALLASGNDIALFASGDVDNYADPSEKDKIYKAFKNLGCVIKERYSGKHQIAAEFFPNEKENLPEGFYISVDFYPLARLKLPCFIKADDFVSWDKCTRYADTNIVLPPADALAYICMLHISLHSFSRAPDIRLYIDLLNISTLSVDYDKLVVWAQKDKTCTRLSVAAELSNYLMKTDYPLSLINISKRRKKVEKLVYNSESNDLIYEPQGIKVLLIETVCDDRNALHGLMKILFPDTKWMQHVYGGCGFFSHLKHFAKVI